MATPSSPVAVKPLRITTTTRVTRRADPRDARARLVELTDRAAAALAAARRFHADYEQRLTDHYGVTEFAAMRDMLTRMADARDEGLDPRLRGLYT